MASSLCRLPTELVEDVCHLLCGPYCCPYVCHSPQQRMFALRLSCRDIYQRTKSVFLRIAFRVVSICRTNSSVARLLEISQHAIAATSVNTLHIMKPAHGVSGRRKVPKDGVSLCD